jgi:predicted ATPase
MRVCLIVSLMHRKQNDTIIVQTFDLVNRILLSFSIKSHQYVKTMELLYVWIEDYKNIHHQGFNFSPKYRFEFEPILSDDKKSVISGTLTDALEEKFKNDSNKSAKILEERKKPFSENFFGDKITNITAIIGENGAGKSNLLEFICKKYNLIFLKFYDRDVGDRFFIILKNKKELVLRKSFDDSFEGFNILLPKSISFTTKPKINEIHSGIFYSSIITLKNDFSIATLQLFPNNSPSENTLLNISNEKILYERYENSVTSFALNENISQIYFIYSNYYNNVISNDVPLKKIQTITLKFYKPNIEINKIGDENLREFFRILFNEVIANDLELFLISDNSKTSTSFIFYGHILLNLYIFLSNEGKKEHIKIFSSLANKFFEEMNLDQNRKSFQDYGNVFNAINEYFRNSLISLLELNSLREIQYELIDRVLDKLLDLLNAIEKTFTKSKKERVYQCSFQLSINIEKQMKEFIESYKKTTTFFNYITFEWTEMSTGEKLMLNLYSRFYSIIERFIFGEKLNKETKNLLILIDEGESGFHPEWQRKYLKYLIDFFPQIYPDKQIQIILTTHSPFLASDLPKENIIFLEKGKDKDGIFTNGVSKKDKCIVVDGLKDKKQTFGANIHTLLSDSFFLEKGLIGEFAKGKINEIIDFYKKIKLIEDRLDKEKVSDKSKDKDFIASKADYESKRDYFWNIQKIIGEDYLAQIIKNHLEEIDFILLKREVAKKEKILRLEKEIEELKKETT